ncbi:glycosyltransferase family 2 protein [soil metagenome]
MSKISVVIITKNEAHNIVGCISSAKKISNDIVIVDSGSTDATVLLAQRELVTVKSITWRGYGDARNTGAEFAKNDWILSLDADERITDELATAILSINFTITNAIYGFRRLNFFGNRKISHGALAHDRVFRLYHKKYSFWNAVPVHEMLVGKNPQRQTLRSHAEHYGIRTEDHYMEKKMSYAYLCALKYKQEKKSFVPALRICSPVFNFVKAYIFQLGFLDKRIGFIIARVNANYTRTKYQQLQQLMKEDIGPEQYEFPKNKPVQLFKN